MLYENDCDDRVVPLVCIHFKIVRWTLNWHVLLVYDYNRAYHKIGT